MGGVEGPEAETPFHPRGIALVTRPMGLVLWDSREENKERVSGAGTPLARGGVGGSGHQA